MPRNVVRPVNDNNNINVLITRIMINIIDALEKYDNNRSIGLRFMLEEREEEKDEISTAIPAAVDSTVNACLSAIFGNWHGLAPSDVERASPRISRGVLKRVGEGGW